MVCVKALTDKDIAAITAAVKQGVSEAIKELDSKKEIKIFLDGKEITLHSSNK